ncbi:hypothetical protein BELL_0440g00040 [Botrytis elliptica]|uniref:AMP-dependent synthetase/ligase domain-containing protein n=1 Tax=Botrytis elliptica TaxID=278938 RepID=A0A4Z1JG36_9HELO|nr:hypothetical protein EAE99_006887 [Botrytis elliptica]TGO72568.1 hypothetical protein BELL_0440g00040 [Botrytis elliptica]
MAPTSSEENLPSPKAGCWRHDKRRLLIDMLDERARVCPDALFGEYPISLINYSQGYRKITYAQLANAVNGAAKFLTEKLGPGKDFQTLCYMGRNDFRYAVFILGAVKAGYKLLLTSPLLTASATTHLFTTMSCKVLLTTSPQPPTVAPVVKLHDYLRVLTIPSIEELLDTAYEYFPYGKIFEEAKGEPLVALHTSGTTGLPKPVIYTHDYAAAYVRALQLEPPEGFESLDRKSEGGRVFSLTAPFHTSAICIMIAAIANQTTYIFPPAATIPTAALAVEGLKHTNDVVGILGGPPLVADCAKDSELLDFFASHVGLMCYGGGDVAQALGDIVSTKLDLYTSHGSTESVSYPLIREIGDREPKDWRYFHAHPAAGLQFRLHPEGENLHEAYIVRNPKPEDEQPVFKLFPTLQEFRTKDLYSPHPSKPDLWIYKMRSDDMIPLSNGQIANPSIMEHAVLDCTGIKEAVVLPVQKIGLENYITCIALLIEPASKVLSTEQKDDLIKELWPVVEKTNSYYRTNASVEKKRILFVDPQKPLARTAKGTISRKRVLEDYKEEVDKLT